MIPPIPYSLAPSMNASTEEQNAKEKQKRKDKVIKSFNSRMQNRFNRRHRRNVTKHLMHLTLQVRTVQWLHKCVGRGVQKGD